MSAVIVRRLAHPCSCGEDATHRLEHLEPSTRGVAIVHGAPRCRRCAERDAAQLLWTGARAVTAHPFTLRLVEGR